MRYVAAVCLAATVACMGCDTGRVTVQPVEQMPVERVPRKMSYDDNIAVGDPRAARDMQSTPYERTFAGAAQELLEGDLELAAEAFQVVIHDDSAFHAAHRGEREAQIVRRAQRALARVQCERGRWGDAVELMESTPGIVDGDVLTEAVAVFARALADAPQESWDIPGRPVVVPMSDGRFGIPTIDVTVNGREFEFWVDTGTMPGVISSDVAEACGIDPLGDGVARGHTATRRSIAFRPALVRNLEIGALHIRNHPVAIVDAGELEFGPAGIPLVKVDGVIGWPVFRRLAVTLDFAAGTATFARSAATADGARNLFWAGYPMVHVLGKRGERLNFGLDTAAQESGLTARGFARLDPPDVSRRRATVGGAGGTETVTLRTARDVVLYVAGCMAEFAGIDETSGVKGAMLVAPDGKLGVDVMRGARVTIDYPAGRFAIDPGAR